MTPPPLLEATRKRSYVYLLRSPKDEKFYLGWTIDLKRRLDAHNRGSIPSTKARTPFDLVYYETYSSQESARDRERKLKHNPNMFYYFKKRALLPEHIKSKQEVEGLCASSPIGEKEVVG